MSSYGPKVYKKDGGDVMVVASGGKIEVESGGEIELQSGAIADLVDKVLEGSDLALAAGSTFAGAKTTGIATAVDISAKGAVLVGQGAGETPAAKALSGDATMSETGAVTIGAKAVTASKIAAAAGTVLVGTKTSGDVTALDISAKGALPFGQGAGETPVAHAISGHVAVAETGVATIQPGVVTAAMLTAGAGVGALLTAGLGNSLSYSKTKDDTTDLLAGGAKAQAVLGFIHVDESIIDNGGTAPTFSVGEESGAVNKFYTAANLATKTAGTVLAFAGIQTLGKKIQVTGTKALTTGLGGITVTVLAIPTS